jgi:hypothetical protein
MWSSHSYFGNWNCTFPAFHLWRVEDEYVKISKPQPCHWGKGQGHGSGGAERVPRGLGQTACKAGREEAGGGICQTPIAHTRPGESPAGQGQACCSDKVNSLGGDISCDCQSQMANSGFFLGNAGQAPLWNFFISGEHQGLP